MGSLSVNNSTTNISRLGTFVLAFFTLRDTIWIGDLVTEAKKNFKINLDLILMDFWCLPQAECSVKKKLLKLGQN
jgi:hypothetical protein